MLDFVLRAGAMYFIALLMIRVLGKRALGELGPFDFVVMTGVGHTVVSVALDKSIPVTEGLVILLTLAVLEYLMGYLSLKNQHLSNIIIGKPVTLIDNGHIIRKNLAKEKFNIDDLMQELRKRGIRDLDDVDKGILEACGGFSVILKNEDEAITRRDLGVNAVDKGGCSTFANQDRHKIFSDLSREMVPGEPEIDLPASLAKIFSGLEDISLRLQRLEQEKS